MNNPITPRDRQLNIIKWAVAISFIFVAVVIYTILSNLGLIIIGLLGFYTYKKLPKIQAKLKPVVQRIAYHAKNRK